MTKIYLSLPSYVYCIAIIALAYTLIIPVTHAQELDAPARDQQRKPFLQQIRDVTPVRPTIKDLRTDFKTQIEANRTTATENRTDYRTQLKEATTNEARTAILEEAKRARLQASDNRSALQNRFTDEAKRRVAKQVQKIMERLLAAIERFERLSTRLQSRIDELSARSIDTTEAQRLLNAVSDATTQAMNDIRAAQAMIDTVVDSHNPRDHIEEVKTALRTAIQSVKDVQKALTAAVRATKAAQQNSDQNDV